MPGHGVERAIRMGNECRLVCHAGSLSTLYNYAPRQSVKGEVRDLFWKVGETLNKYAQLWPSEGPKVTKDFCRNVENLSRKADTEIWLF
jgi:hypothetical protein